MKRTLTLPGLIVVLAALLPSGVFAQMAIDASFDSGSIGPYSIDDGTNTIAFSVLTDGVGYEYWTHFNVSGVLNETVTFRILNGGAVPFLADTAHESQMVYTCDGANWNRITNHSYSVPMYEFTQTFTCDEAQIATFFPFSFTKMSDFVDTVSTSPWVDAQVLGVSEQGRDLDLLVITDPAIPTEDKTVIYIIGRQHAAETADSHMLEGMIEFLISSDVDAGAYRQNCVYYIVPMVNPDGVYVGNSRATSEGNDANRDWHWSNTDTGEVATVRSHIDSIHTSYGIDLFIDWHNQMDDTRWYNFIYSPSGNDFFTVLSSWTDFDSQSAGGVSSCTLSACSSRAWGTDEGLYTFIFEPCPHLFTWTIADMQQEGVNVAHAIGEYFGAYSYPLLSDPYFDASGTDADLRDDTPGVQDWYESRSDVPALLTLDEADIGGNTEKKAALKNYGNGGGNAYLTQNFGTPQSGSFSVSFDIYVDRIEEYTLPAENRYYNRTGFIYMGDNSDDSDPGDAGKGPNSTSVERLVYLVFYDPDPTAGDNDLEIRARELNYHSSGASQSWHRTHEWTQVTSGLSYDTWYTVKLDVDYSTGTYDVSVDGVLEGDDIAGFEDYSGNPLTHLSFSVGDTGRGDFYVDNVEEYVEGPICVDGDGDGHDDMTPECPSGTDCDDSDENVNPDHAEVCNNGIDDDCDGDTDCDDADCTGGPLLQDSGFSATVSDADLRDTSPPGEHWYESREDAPSLVTLDTADVGGNHTNKAGLAASSSGNAYLTQRFGVPQTGLFAVEWEVYVESILDISGDPDRAAWMLIGDETDATRPGANSDDGERFVYMGFHRDGGGGAGATMDLVAIDRDDSWESFTTVASGLTIGQWYTIRVICNLATDTYDVYLNGAFQASVTSRNAKDYVTHISFAQWSDGAGAFYVDNVTDAFLDIFAQEFGRTDCAWCLGDLDGDEDVDGGDLSTHALDLGFICP